MEKVYSQRLGPISDEQFQAALDYFDLGRFIRAEPIPFGLFGQNIFVTSTTGEYVFRGNPHFGWQFPAEQFYARFLREQAYLPAPWPYLVDPTNTIFGWSYVLMPRMVGLQLADPTIRDGLSLADKRDVARTLGETVAIMQEAKVPFSGRFNASSGKVEPFDLGHEVAWPFPVEMVSPPLTIPPTIISFSERVTACLRHELTVARTTNEVATPQADLDWVEECIVNVGDALNDSFEPSLVLPDYRGANLAVIHENGRWRVSGVFDLMEAYFGDGEASLARQYAVYLEEEDGAALSREFLEGFWGRQTPRPGFVERLRLFILLDRAIVWAYGQREKVNWWSKEQTFRTWASPYLVLSNIL